jgi:hypothetical protein
LTGPGRTVPCAIRSGLNTNSLTHSLTHSFTHSSLRFLFSLTSPPPPHLHAHPPFFRPNVELHAPSTSPWSPSLVSRLIIPPLTLARLRRSFTARLPSNACYQRSSNQACSHSLHVNRFIHTPYNKAFFASFIFDSTPTRLARFENNRTIPLTSFETTTRQPS